MPKVDLLQGTGPAFRLTIATSWLAPDSWRQNQERTIREAVAAEPDWMEYLSLVDRHQTQALSWAALSRVQGISVPELVRRELQKRSDACRIQGMQHSLVLVDVLKKFNRAGIPAMPLKGPVLSFALCGDVGLRQSEDLDLQVPREDLSRAMACLESGGWHPGPNSRAMSPRQWDSFLHNEHDIHFVHYPTGRCLELHWRNHWEASDAASARWARSVPSVWQRCSIQAMSPGDLTLYLCTHGGFHLWSRAKWLGDLACAHCSGLLDWEAAIEEARRWGQERVLLAGLWLLHEVYGLAVPELPENVRMGRSLLLRMPLQALKDSQAASDGIGLTKLCNRLRTSRYERLLRPRRAWRDSLAELFYSSEDFAMLPLPDSLFWAYKPLRPVLWLWRWVWLAWRQTPERNPLRANR